jgi:anti-sigma28 factor (negative regulator of flagellin synthesis)
VSRPKTTNEIKRIARIELLRLLVRNGNYVACSEEVAEALTRALDELDYNEQSGE